MKKVMLLAAMLAMVLAAAVPALAQTQAGQGNVACVQSAANVEIGKVQISQYGDNINIQQIAQECNITVAEVNTIVAEAAATASASASAPATVQYEAAAAQYQYASASAAAEELPSTGGSSLIALGAGVLLVAGGLLARRIVR